MTSFLAALLLLNPSGSETVTYRVNGVQRQADVFAPRVKSTHPPLVFGFHGHGGNSKNAARSFQIQDLWPEAVVVYMQGLPTPSAKVDPNGKMPGWQNNKGLEGDRDLDFFDTVYKDVTQRFKVDLDRVYSMGHSNGGRFTYLLMQQRGDLFAAFAPSGSPAHLVGMPAKPVFHIAGEKDPLVNFDQQSRSLQTIKRRNGCSEQGKKTGTYTTLYRGKDGNDVITYFHPGGHEYPRQEAPPLIVEFFKAHKR
ncbi:MAG: prolyl oligopeptidase family serine peptidase [Armatimonadetes bacterium]|nr:prolyl oligopeptidase family serine peptidase [Armatimonadota bacterium]